MTYIFIFVYTAFLAYIYSKRKRSTSKKLTVKKIKNAGLFLLMIIPSILIAGLRYGISVDYVKVYERGFSIISNNYNNSEFEIGFTWLVKLCSIINDNAWFMFLTVSLITICIYFKAFDISKNYLFSVLLFFGAGVYFDSFNGIRQYIVCAIFLYSFKYIEQNNWKKYFIIMGLCTLIHTSAIFTLPLYFLKKVKINKIYCILISVVLLIFSNKIYDFIVVIISAIPKYNEYIIRNTISSQISLSSSGIIMAIIALIPCILSEKSMFKTENGTFLYNLMMVGLIIAISTSFLPFAERLLYFTRTGILVAVPYSLSLLNGKKKNIIEIATIGAMSALNYTGMFMLNWYAVLPYVSIFNK